MFTFVATFQISLLSLRPSKSDKSLHQTLSNNSSNTDSASVSATETSVMNVENTVVTSGTVETYNGLSGFVRPDNVEHITETVEETVEAASPPQESADGRKN
jgi:hypothetical protein